jgi:hypothetical protein
MGVKRLLEQQLKVSVSGSTTRGQTGAFEVFGSVTGKLYFSRQRRMSYSNGPVVQFPDADRTTMLQLIEELVEDGAVRREGAPALAVGPSCAIM